MGRSPAAPTHYRPAGYLAAVEDQVTRPRRFDMTGADAPTTDRDYLYGPVDFEAWLARLT